MAMASRSLSALLPHVQEKATAFLGMASGAGIDVLVYCTYREPEEQEQLFKEGRTKARAYRSWHQYRRAWDCVPMVAGKPLWRTHDSEGNLLWQWDELGRIAAVLGIEWAGNWSRFREYVHFQVTDGLDFPRALWDLVARGYLTEAEAAFWEREVRGKKAG